MDNVKNSISGVTASAITDTNAVELIPAQGGETAVHITALTVTNSDASVGTEVQLLNGATVRWTGFASSAGGGFTLTFPSPLKGAANTAWSVKAVTTSAEVLASVAGYKSIL
jgi:hypothetical protein